MRSANQTSAGSIPHKPPNLRPPRRPDAHSRPLSIAPVSRTLGIGREQQPAFTAASAPSRVADPAVQSGALIERRQSQLDRGPDCGGVKVGAPDVPCVNSLVTWARGRVP